MSDLSYWFGLGVVAILTSIVSGVMGMAGGMLLLAAMLLRLEPAVAIPVHGAVQLVSNASRAFFLRGHLKWPVVWRFAWPLLPAGALGIALLGYVPPAASRLIIAGFVLIATWAPQALQLGKRTRNPASALPLGGALVGFFSTLIGATGPLLAPFVLALELASQPTVATIAACQVFQHASKLALFGVRGFAFEQYALPALVLCLGAVLGSAIGTRLLDKLPERTFRRLIKLTLTVLALLQLYQAV